MKEERKCETCAWWDGEKRRDGLPSRFGYCHGAPPMPQPGIMDGIWPRTPPAEWCGIYKPTTTD